MDMQARTAVINARVATFLGDLEGMKALNAERESKGLSQHYPEAAFMDLLKDAGIDENTVIEFLRD